MAVLQICETAICLFRNNLYALNNDRRCGNVLHIPAVVSRFGACNSVKHVKSVGEHTECRILTVKEWGILVHYEELRRCRVWNVGASHRENAANVLQIVHREAVCSEFATDRLCVGILHILGVATALNHKSADNAVEYKSLVKSALCKLYKVCNGERSLFGIELGNYLAVIFDSEFDLRMIHWCFSFRYTRSPIW